MLSQNKNIHINAQGYYSGVPTFSQLLTSEYDIVISIDVLEHIGKLFIHSTIQEISTITGKFFFSVSTYCPHRKKQLMEEIHIFWLRQLSGGWWINQIKNEFKIITLVEVDEMPDGMDYPMHLFGCATNSMRNFKRMNTFPGNIEAANKRWAYNDRSICLKSYS